MKKIIILLLALFCVSAYSQSKDSINLGKPKVFSRAVPIVEYEISQTSTPFITQKSTYYIVETKLWTLRQGQNFFEIFSRWENLTRQESGIEEIKKKHQKQVDKELKLIGYE